MAGPPDTQKLVNIAIEAERAVGDALQTLYQHANVQFNATINAISALQSETTSLQGRLMEVNRSNECWQTSYGELRQENDTIHKQMNNIHRRASEADQALLRLQASLDFEKSRNADLQASETALRTRNTELEAELAGAVGSKQALEKMRDQAVEKSDDLQKELDELQTRADIIFAINEQSEARHQGHYSEKQAFKRRIQTLLDELASTRSQRSSALEDLDFKATELADLKESLQHRQAASESDGYTNDWSHHGIDWMKDEDASDYAYIMAHQNEAAKALKRKTIRMLSHSRNKLDQAQKENDTLRNKAESSESEMKRLRQEKASAEASVRASSQHVEVLNEQIQRSEDRANAAEKAQLTIEKAKIAAEDRAKEAESHNCRLRKELAAVNLSVRDGKDMLKVKQKELENAEWREREVKRQQRETEAEYELERDKATTESKERAREASDLRTQLKVRDCKYNEAKEQCLRDEVEFEVLREKQQQLEQASEEEKKKNASSRAEGLRLIADLRNQLQQLEEEKGEESKKTAEMEQKNTRTAGELEASRTELEQLRKALTEETEKVHKYEQEITKAIEDLGASCKQRQQELETSPTKLQGLQKAFNSETEKTTKHEQEATRLTEDLVNSRSQLQRLQKALTDETEKLATTRAEYSLAAEEIGTLEDEQMRLNAIVSEERLKVANFKAAKTELHQKLASVSEEIRQIRKYNTTSEEGKGTVAVLKQRLQERDDELAMYKQEMNGEKQKASDAEASRRTLEEDCRRKVSDADARVRDAMEMVSMAQRRNETLNEPPSRPAAAGEPKSKPSTPSKSNSSETINHRINFTIKGAATAQKSPQRNPSSLAGIGRKALPPTYSTAAASSRASSILNSGSPSKSHISPATSTSSEASSPSKKRAAGFNECESEYDESNSRRRKCRKRSHTSRPAWAGRCVQVWENKFPAQESGQRD
ncbi:hypothetical protein Q7P37_010916 [Cladosporium fusiforme]